MKIISIGDIHGRDIWEKIDFSKCDKVIFHGDYWDSHDDISFEDQLINFNKIIALKNKFPDKIVLLVGNHDLHYIINNQYSGYQSLHDHEIKHLVQSNINIGNLQAIFQHEKYIFSHAGLTVNWLLNNNIEADNFNYINELLFYKPETFHIAGYSIYGDSIHDGPMWVRPFSLIQDILMGYTQIIGHTSYEKVLDYNYFDQARLYFIDTLGSATPQYIKIDTETNKVEIINIKE
jgi:hypothetical protein